MAAKIRASDPSAKQAKAAAKVATFKAEQARLKDLAAKRRAAAAASQKGRSGATSAERPWSVGHGGGRQDQR